MQINSSMRISATLLFLLFAMMAAPAQVPPSKPGQMVAYRLMPNGDTLYITTIPQVTILAPPQFRNRAQARRYTRLEYNVRKVYPYVVIIRQQFKILNQHYLSLKTDKERKAYARKVEEDIRNQFEGELKRLTITQGRILIKLIDRETGITSFALLQEFRGKLTAFFWQTLARLFGINLKDAYDGTGEDQVIEEIILRIESGH